MSLTWFDRLLTFDLFLTTVYIKWMYLSEDNGYGLHQK